MQHTTNKMEIRPEKCIQPFTPIHTSLFSMLTCFYLMFTHIQSNLGTLTCRLEQSWIEPPTFRLEDDLLYLLSDSHPIHSFSSAYPIQGFVGRAEAYPSFHSTRGGYTLDSRRANRARQTTICTHIHTYKQFRVNN